MTKQEVVDKKLVSFVLHPGLDEVEPGQIDWWKSLGNDEDVEVKFPYEQHGLTGKPSNHTKPAIWEAFLRFVDIVIQMVTKWGVVAHSSTSYQDLHELFLPQQERKMSN